MKISHGLLAALVVGAGASVASASFPIITYTLDGLNGAYAGNSGGGVYTATANAGSQGNATRTVTPIGSTAEFNVGTLPGASAAYSLTLNVFGIGSGAAFGTGSFSFVDLNGDSITGSVSGAFSDAGGIIFFNGLLSAVALNNTSGDGTFDGTSGGSWSMNFGSVGALDGAITNLTFLAPDFFASSWSGISSQVTAQIVPAPGAVALVGLAGLVAGRRRR
jgi:hypothetical protein